jgi:uncharacterized protein YgfB (UPF0149 family)
MHPPATPNAPVQAATHYDELERLLQLSPLSPSAAEAQGIFLGLLSGKQAASSDADAQTPEHRLLAELFPAVDAGPAANAAAAVEPAPERPADAAPAAAPDASQVERCRTLLAELAAQARAQAEGAGMELQLLLPAEERPLRERAIAVHGWTRGFLFGLGLSGIDAGSLSAPAREAFDDLLEITRMDLDDLDDEQANEEALTEIVEFIRVAAQLMIEEQTPGASAAASAAQETH